ncbi:hypothetical protein ACFY13_52110 [Streptomyces mirabilis]|uniref:hypothetical protein n=1 Tax=Streptomyces mirabilis TaxID=68239 RepID=UPI00364D840F
MSPSRTSRSAVRSAVRGLPWRHARRRHAKVDPLIPHRSDTVDEGALPGDCRRILAIVREADGPVQVRAVGERLGLDTAVRGKLEPLRAKMTKLADRGWLHKRPDGRFTARS